MQAPADDDDDDDVDLFGEETEEEKKAAEERAAAVKASGKKKECMPIFLIHLFALTLFWKYAPSVSLHCYWSFVSLLTSHELQSLVLMFPYPVSWEVVSFA